jgi:hypothetical protein
VFLCFLVTSFIGVLGSLSGRACNKNIPYIGGMSIEHRQWILDFKEVCDKGVNF